MRPLRNLIIYFFAVFIGSAVLAPLIYELVNFTSTRIEFFQPLANKGFHRYLTRCMMAIGIIGLIPLFRSFNVKNLAGIGLPSIRENWKKPVYGFLFGFFTLLIPVAIALGSGSVGVNLSRPEREILRHIINAAFSATVVAILEEILFRGGILGALKKVYGWNKAILISSAVYSIVHFFQKLDNFPDVHWYSGFVALGMMLRGFVDFNSLIPGFLNLFIAGALLGLFYKITGNIYFSIGVHCGWIFWLKSYKFFAIFDRQYSRQLFGSDKLIDGWMTFIVLFLVIIAVLKIKKMHSKVPDVQS